jgi:hypothetical protein
MSETIIRAPGRPEPVFVRIHSYDFPLPTDDLETIEKACMQPVTQPGVVRIGSGTDLPVKTPDDQQALVIAGYQRGFNAGQALLALETSRALDEIRSRLDVFEKGMRAVMEAQEALAEQAQVGQDGKTASRFRELQEGLRTLRKAFFPDDDV